MAATRPTFTLDDDMTERARRLGINVSAAARQDVADAVRAALAESDRTEYEHRPERPDPFWDDVDAWTQR